MKKIIIPAFLLGTIAIASCKGGASHDGKLTGKWKGVSIESPTEDSMSLLQEQAYLQQVDQLTTVDENMKKEFKTSNLDSIKTLLRGRVAEQKNMMAEQKQKSAQGLEFTLEGNGNAIVKIDSAKYDTFTWYSVNVDNNTLLYIDPMIKGKEGSLMAFKVLEAKGDDLKLAVHQTSDMKMSVNLKKVK